MADRCATRPALLGFDSRFCSSSLRATKPGLLDAPLSNTPHAGQPSVRRLSVRRRKCAAAFATGVSARRRMARGPKVRELHRLMGRTWRCQSLLLPVGRPDRLLPLPKTGRPGGEDCSAGAGNRRISLCRLSPFGAKQKCHLFSDHVFLPRLCLICRRRRRRRAGRWAFADVHPDIPGRRRRLDVHAGVLSRGRQGSRRCVRVSGGSRR